MNKLRNDALPDDVKVAQTARAVLTQFSGSSGLVATGSDFDAAKEYFTLRRLQAGDMDQMREVRAAPREAPHGVRASSVWVCGFPPKGA